jgi:hypothetical protein
MNPIIGSLLLENNFNIEEVINEDGSLSQGFDVHHCVTKNQTDLCSTSVMIRILESLTMHVFIF